MHITNVADQDLAEVMSDSSASLTDASENYDILSTMLPILKQEEAEAMQKEQKSPAPQAVQKKAANASSPQKPQIAHATSLNTDLA